MKKQILTGLGVLLLGTSMAVASPQSFRGNFNDQPAYQTHRQPRQSSRRMSDQYRLASRRIPQVQRHRHNDSRMKHRNSRRFNNRRG